MKIKAKRIEDNKIVTGLVRVGFLNVFEPEELSEKDKKKGREPKYRLMIWFPKGSDTEKILKECMLDVATEEWKKKKPAGWNSGLRDGDSDSKLDHDSEDEFMIQKCETLEGNRFLNASTRFKPEVLGRLKPDGSREELKPGDIKGGDYVQMSINCFPYEADGNQGVGFGFDTIVLKRVCDKDDAVFNYGGGAPSTDLGAFDDDDDLPEDEDDEEDEAF